MKECVFKINGRVDIWVENSNYKSSIQNITDKYIALSAPIKDGTYVPLRVGEQLEVVYYEGLDVYKFYSLVIGRDTEDNLPQILLAQPENIKRIQRRQFVRVPVIIYIEYLKAETEAKIQHAGPNASTQAVNKALLMDLSGGGMRIKVYSPLKVGDRIITEIPSENERISVKGEVVRVEKGEDGRLVCGVCFTELDNRTREKVIQLIFSIMRKQRKTL
jgi:c-di-GMP-binding flagellar brake protein YcgR